MSQVGTEAGPRPALSLQQKHAEPKRRQHSPLTWVLRPGFRPSVWLKAPAGVMAALLPHPDEAGPAQPPSRGAFARPGFARVSLCRGCTPRLLVQVGSMSSLQA